MIEKSVKRIVLLFSLVFTVLLLSVFALSVVAQTEDPVSPEQPNFPRCVGGDIHNLEGVPGYDKCLRFLDKFEKYAQQDGVYALGADMLYIFVKAKWESGCKSRFVDGESGGGILQATSHCTSNPATNKCHNIDDEIHYGLMHAAKDMKTVLDAGITGTHAFWLSMFAYNRGRGAAKNAIKFMNEGMSIQDACDKSCLDAFHSASKRKPSLAERCYSWAKKAYNCQGSEGSSMCDNGRTCAENTHCGYQHEEVGIHYADQRWLDYVKQCAAIGGHLETDAIPEIPSTTPGATSPGLTGTGGVGTGVAGQFIPTHPYFDVPYSIDPSFSVEGDFDFSIYEYVPKNIKQLERCKDDLDCIVESLEEIEYSDSNYDWMAKYAGNVVTKDGFGESETSKWMGYCEYPDLFAVTSFSEAIDTAKSSSGSDCVVPFDVFDWSSGQESSWLSVATISIGRLFGIPPFALSLVEGTIDRWSDSIPIVHFISSGESVKIYLEGGEAPAQQVNNVKFSGLSEDLQEGEKNQMIFSSDIGRIYVYKDDKGNISIYSKDAVPTTTECEVFNKVVKFCVVQNESVLAYDESLNRLGIKQLALKFAYLFKSDVTDVTNFVVRDAKYSSNTSLLSWDELEGVDVEYYTIYYSENPSAATTLKSTSPTEALQDEGIAEDLESVRVYVANKDSMLAIDLDQEPLCEVGTLSPLTCALKYTIPTLTSGEDVSFEVFDEQLYYDENAKTFFYFLPGLKDDYRYSFAITATDVNGEESPTFSVVDNAVYEESVNDVPPGLVNINGIALEGNTVTIVADPLDYNIDSSALDQNAIKHFRIFCMDSSSGSDIDLLSRPSFFESGYAITDTGELHILADLNNFNTANCGFQSLPAEVSLVIAGVSMDGLTEIYYKGRATPMSFSDSTLIIPEPAP